MKAASVLATIGNTPHIRINRLFGPGAEVWIKSERGNPGGSIKDRIALAMVEAAERDGSLKPGGTLVEATAGNTGLGLALVASQKGYRLILVIPDKMSQEKIFHLKAMGAEVVMTRSDVGIGHPEYYQDMAKRIAVKTPGAFYVNQFENPANPAIHEATTAPEIWEQMAHKLDAVVCGVGSGGTITGIGRYFARTAPDVEMVLADPQGSILAPYIEHGIVTQAGSWLVEGIGEDFVPNNFEAKLVKRAYTIADRESIDTARLVLQKEGVLCGSSSGTLIAAALKYARAQKKPKRIVTFVCDSGNKYLSKIYNEAWLGDNGLAETQPTHDLRDLIARPFARGQVITAAPGESLQQVYAKMKTNDISQLPVMDKGIVLGIIDETDVLLAVAGNPAGFTLTAGAVMANNKLAIVPPSKRVIDLVEIFERGCTACVVEDGKFLGLITPIDFLNYLRRRTAQA